MGQRTQSTLEPIIDHLFSTTNQRNRGLSEQTNRVGSKGAGRSWVPDDESTEANVVSEARSESRSFERPGAFLTSFRVCLLHQPLARSPYKQFPTLAKDALPPTLEGFSHSLQTTGRPLFPRPNDPDTYHSQTTKSPHVEGIEKLIRHPSRVMTIHTLRDGRHST